MLEGRERKEKKELERRKESSISPQTRGGGGGGGEERGKTVTKNPFPTYRYVLELKSTPTILKVRKKT